MSRLETLYSPPEIGAPGKREARARRRVLFYSGLFVLAMAGVVAAALTLVIPGLLGGSYRIDAYFAYAEGLDGGIQVIQDGYIIGIVESVSPVFPGRDADAEHCPPFPADAPPRSAALPCFRASLRIRDRWPIPVDTRARLGPAGLLAGEAIKLEPGASSELLADGSPIGVSAREKDLPTQLDELAADIKALLGSDAGPNAEPQGLAKVVADVEGLLGTFEALLGTVDARDGQAGALAGATTDAEPPPVQVSPERPQPQGLAKVIKTLEEISGQLHASLEKGGKIDGIVDSARGASDALTKIAAQLPETIGKVDRSVDEIGDLAERVQTLVKENSPALERSLDDTQYLLQELSASLMPILTNIEDATRNLSALARDLRSDPAVIIKGREVQEETPWFR